MGSICGGEGRLRRSGHPEVMRGRLLLPLHAHTHSVSTILTRSAPVNGDSVAVAFKDEMRGRSSVRRQRRNAAMGDDRGGGERSNSDLSFILSLPFTLGANSFYLGQCGGVLGVSVRMLEDFSVETFERKR